ncbi:MAG: tctC [Betaproteobacteria bacterium]|nr:tctC [Betaproteobacteria bacterium]
MKHFSVIAGLAMVALSFPAAAQRSSSYPGKPVRIVVAFVPGGITDIVGRAVARRLEEMGQPVVVDNRGGANGQVGSALVAKAPPDGYTLLIGSLGTHGIAPSLYPNLGYDAVKDFEHVSMIAVVGNLMVVNAGMPAKNLKELIALAKKNPGKLNYGAVGGSSQLMSELINSMADIRTVHVPYKGAAPATVAVLNGEVDFLLHAFSGLMPLVQAGKLRAIAVTTDKRSPLAPDVPTMSEAGLPGYNASTWFSLAAPARTPREVVAKLNQVVVKGLRSPEMIESFTSQNAQVMITTPAGTADFLRAEIAKWAKVIKAAGVKPDAQ